MEAYYDTMCYDEVTVCELIAIMGTDDDAYVFLILTNRVFLVVFY